MENKENQVVVEKTVAEKLEEARIHAQSFVAQRIKEYEVVIKQFDEAIDSYAVLIAIVNENKDRFRVRYTDIVEQFTATKLSFETQQKNIIKHQKRLQKVQNNPSKYSAKDILEALEI